MKTRYGEGGGEGRKKAAAFAMSNPCGFILLGLMNKRLH